MSASVVLTAEQMQQIGAFLKAVTAATAETGVKLCAYNRTELAIGGNVLAVNFDASTGEYVIDDRVGE